MAVRQKSQAAQARADSLYWVRGSSVVTIPATTSASLISFDGALGAALGETVRNWTIERIIGNLVATVPAGTTAGRSYQLHLAIDMVEYDAIAAGSFPEPFSDQGYSFPWIDGRRVFAGDNPPSSFASPGINGMIFLDMRSKRRAKGSSHGLRMFGNHDNGLATNPALYFNYSALFRLR